MSARRRGGRGATIAAPARAGARALARALALALSVGLATVLTTPSRAAAQAQPFRLKPRTQLGWQLDAIGGDAATVQGGASVNVPAGHYVRVGATLAAGPVRRDDTIVGGARLEIAARYLLDPFREHRWGLYGGAGLALRQDAADVLRPWVVLLVGLERARPVGHWAPALEVGLGGGVRVGLALRRARANGR